MTHTAAIMIVGNEILSGRTQDENVRFIAEKLAARGIRLLEVRVVRDEEAAIVKCARELSGTYDFVFSTGGIGPTHDDITADCIAKAFGTETAIDPEARRALESYYEAKGDPLTEGRLRMARIPKGATLLANPVSGAPGFKLKNVYVMAGVPRIMQAMFTTLEPILPQGLPMLSATVVCSLRESEIARGLEDIQKAFPDVEIGSYPTFSSLSIVLRTTNAARLKEATEKTLVFMREKDPAASIS